jgi:tetratricopeptide (TPR) repeat protein
VSLAITVLLGLALLLAPIYAAVPDDPHPIWSSWLCAATLLAMSLAAWAAWRGDKALSARLTRPEKLFLALLGLAFLSVPLRLAMQHGMGYLGPMLRGWTLLASSFTAFALARRVSAQPHLFLGLILAAVIGSVIVADIGVQEYVVHVRAGQSSWRIFATSTPDFLAGYMVLLLPVTLALFLQTPARRSLTGLLRGLITFVLGVVLLFQLVTMLTTGSRFALVSLTVALLVFGVSLWQACCQGLALDKATRLLLGALAVGLVVGGLLFARPVFARLQNLNDNSTAFRAWTWKGAVRMAAANPLLGTGIGIWSDQYPRYASTGFTRLAHNSYLQVADECGIPALVILLATLGTLASSLPRGLSRPAGEPSQQRLLLCGLSAALAGGAVQNLVDSNWYVFFLSSTFWTFAGLAAGIALPASSQEDAEARPSRRLVLLAAGSVAGLCTLFMAAQGIAAVYAAQASEQIRTAPAEAALSYGAAQRWDPLNASYPRDLGYKVYESRLGDLFKAETALQSAVALEPNSLSYRRLGDVLQQLGRQPEAISAYEAGLRSDPHDLKLLLNLARLCPAPQSLEYYKRVSDLELTPVGTVRALGESTETAFSIGDAVIGDSVAATDPAQAERYYGRAAQGLERFADEGGSLNMQQVALNGGNANPHQDAEMRGLYQHVLTAWAALAPPEDKAVLRQRQDKYGLIFDRLCAESSKPGIL